MCETAAVIGRRVRRFAKSEEQLIVITKDLDAIVCDEGELISLCRERLASDEVHARSNSAMRSRKARSARC